MIECEKQNRCSDGLEGELSEKFYWKFSRRWIESEMFATGYAGVPISEKLECSLGHEHLTQGRGHIHQWRRGEDMRNHWKAYLSIYETHAHADAHTILQVGTCVAGSLGLTDITYCGWNWLFLHRGSMCKKENLYTPQARLGRLPRGKKNIRGWKSI